MDYYLAINGETVGQYDEKQLARMWRNGSIDQAAQVRAVTSQEWRPVSDWRRERKQSTDFGWIVLLTIVGTLAAIWLAFASI